MGLLPLDGRPIFFQPFEITQLARAGRWDQRPFLDELEKQAFAAILIYRMPTGLQRQRWTDEMLGVIERRYVSSSASAVTAESGAEPARSRPLGRRRGAAR